MMENLTFLLKLSIYLSDTVHQRNRGHVWSLSLFLLLQTNYDPYTKHENKVIVAYTAVSN